MKGIFTMIDQFNEQTKIELEDILLNTENHPDRIFFYLSKTLDQLVMKIKENITKMYEDVYRFIKVQRSQSGENKPKEDPADYLKNRIINAKEEKKKSNMGQIVKQNFKNEDKNTFLAKLIMGKTMNNTNDTFQANQQILKEAVSANKQSAKTEIDRMKSAEPERNKKDLIIKKVQQKPLQNTKNPQIQGTKRQNPTIQKKKVQLPLPTEPPKQPRLNSFMQALFGAFQKQPEKSNADNPPPIDSQIDENKKKQTQKQSKLSTIKQFQRKRSVKEMLKSPKAQILLNRSPYH